MVAVEAMISIFVKHDSNFDVQRMQGAWAHHVEREEIRLQADKVQKLVKHL
jgi:hypothetical protein